MKNLHLILGSPGCGKTTRLLETVDEALNSGLRPDQIGFVSFTRKAANEAAERAGSKFGLARKELPYFRTLHSCAYRALGLEKNEILSDYRPIADALGLSFKVDPDQSTFIPSGSGRHMEVPFLEALARNRCISLEQQWHDWQATNPDEYLDWHVLDLYRRTLREYKNDMGYYDYTDILEAFVRENLRLPVKLLIVDEGQDLSRLQWMLIKGLAASVDTLIVAGDDDQCIYQWAGADIQTFLQLSGTREVLQQSHRLPRNVFTKAQEVVSRIHNRYAKVWQPRQEDGEYRECGTLEAVPIVPDETYMFLARNHYHLNQVKAFLREVGYFYATVGKQTSVREDYLTGIRRWERLRKGGEASPEEALTAYDLMRTGHAIERGARKRLLNLPESARLTLADLSQDFGLRTDAIWHEVMDAIPLEDREYIIACLRNRERLDRPPRIYVGTIHSVKGGEADNVALIPDLSRLTWKSYTNSEEAENRVLYVGVTRARKRLFALFPSTPRYYFI